ncbi:MAG: DUF1127 domain-containing protein [Pseudomonadota bacterium]
MATYDTARPLAPATTTAGLLSPVIAVYDALTAWMDAARTRRALKGLNTHQLNDIGLHASDDIDLFLTKYR